MQERFWDEATVKVLLDQGSDSDNNVNRSDCIHTDLKYTWNGRFFYFFRFDSRDEKVIPQDVEMGAY